MQDLNRTLLERFLQDLKMRQMEFRTDHTISTALEIAIRETERLLKEQTSE